MKPVYQHIYGPVYSWRLGRSLGIDPISHEAKICNLNCLYCQLGETQKFENERQVFVPSQAILDEVKAMAPVDIDCITFSGRGEPTLAKNLGELIQGVRHLRSEKIAVITNAALIDRVDVQQDLRLADIVLAKLDAGANDTFRRVSRPVDEVRFSAVRDGLCAFRKNFNGHLALQVMLIAQNKTEASAIAKIAHQIHPDEVQINTPLRPSATKPLTKKDIDDIKKAFTGLYVTSVFDAPAQPYQPFDDAKTAARHGEFKK